MSAGQSAFSISARSATLAAGCTTRDRPPLTTIILSYRREDTELMVGRICDRLREHFGRDSVMMDIDSIPYGLDFRKHIKETFKRCDMMLAVIGPRWAGVNEEGQTRLADETDSDSHRDRGRAHQGRARDPGSRQRGADAQAERFARVDAGPGLPPSGAARYAARFSCAYGSSDRRDGRAAWPQSRRRACCGRTESSGYGTRAAARSERDAAAGAAKGCRNLQEGRITQSQGEQRVEHPATLAAPAGRGASRRAACICGPPLVAACGGARRRATRRSERNTRLELADGRSARCPGGRDRTVLVCGGQGLFQFYGPEPAEPCANIHGQHAHLLAARWRACRRLRRPLGAPR